MKSAHSISSGSAEPEGSPASASGPGHFYLWFPLRHTLSLVLRELGAARREPRVLPGGDGLIVALDGEDVESFASRVAEALSSEETAGTRVLWVPGEREPGLADFPRVSSLRQFLAGSRTSWLRGLLEEDRVTCYFQPIVAASDTTLLFGYEALLRAFEHDTTPVSPAALLSVARETELLSEVDLAGRRTALREASRHGLRTQLFINLAQDPGAEPAHAAAGLEATVRAAREAGFSPDRIVLEVIESPHVLELSHLAQTLTAYRERGFRIALDDLGAGYSSLNLMSLLRPDFVKLDLQLVRQVDRDPYKAVIAEKVLELARRLGIATIAEGVETPGELTWLRDHGTDYVQGYLIGAPASPPVPLFRRL